MFLTDEDGTQVELSEENMAVLDVAHEVACRDLEGLQEAGGIVGRYKVTKVLKLKRMVAKAANLIAKQGGDPLYSKMLFHFLKMKTFRAAIQKKYGNRGKALVRVYLTRKNSPLHK